MTFHVDTEILTQPDCWARAAELAPEVAAMLPAAGERVAFIGCGTSWFVAQVAAAWRESAGLGESDAFTASELPDRPYDRVVAITRSGTTTEVLEVLGRLRGKLPTVIVLGDQNTAGAEAADAVIDLSFADEQSVVQTRFATTALALFRAWTGQDLAPVIEQASEALAVELDRAWVEADQISFVGVGWTIGIAHEAALKFRETSSSWAESYPAMDYRHGPIAIAAPGRVTWMFGEPPAGLAEQVAATGATFVASGRDALAELVLVQRVAVARAKMLGVNPDQPRSLTRSVVLADS